jgi:two-component sensor histidine kinase
MFQALLNIGITDTTDIYQKRETKILNLFAVITLTGILIGLTNIFFLGSDYPGFIILFLAFACAFVLLLNKWDMHRAAAYLFVISLNIDLFFVNEYYPTGTASFLYYFPMIFCIALLHNPGKSSQRDFLFFIIIALSFIGVGLFPDKGIFERAILSNEQIKIVFYYNVNICGALTAILVYLVIRFINNQYAELNESLKKSANDQVMIETSLQEKEVLLAEIQHRVKNNMSVIIGLFNMQKEGTDNEETKRELTEARNRVLSIAMVHERLYKKGNLSRISLKNYISNLCKEIIYSHPLHDKIKFVEEIEDLDTDITRAVPIGLIVNEAITNSLKHAFNQNSASPVITMRLAKQFDTISLKIRDNGPGFPETKKGNDRALGLSLIESLTDQLDGKLHLLSEEGAIVKIVFPL